MARRASRREWLPLERTSDGVEEVPSGEAFRIEWIDFERGIRVGNLEPHERITRILRFHLENTYDTPFLTDRWGRGQHWQWICWLPRANRDAKPLSSKVNFGCAKLFVCVDRGQRLFQAGLQVERGVVQASGADSGFVLREDWDWHRLVEQCREGSLLDRELGRLILQEGFVAGVGAWEARAVFRAGDYRTVAQIRRVLEDAPLTEWVGFQVYYGFSEKALGEGSGADVMRAVCAVFDAVVPAMNACMQIPLRAAGSEPGAGDAVEGPGGTFRRQNR